MTSSYDYKEIAKMKYEKYLNEKKEEENKRLIDEIIKNEEIESINDFYIDLGVSIDELNPKLDLIEQLKLIESKIESIIELIKKYDRFSELQNKIPTLVDILNKTSELNKKKLNYINNVGNIIKDIFKLCEVDIEIELMDTSKDDEYAKKIQENEYA